MDEDTAMVFPAYCGITPAHQFWCKGWWNVAKTHSTLWRITTSNHWKRCFDILSHGTFPSPGLDMFFSLPAPKTQYKKCISRRQQQRIDPWRSLWWLRPLRFLQYFSWAGSLGALALGGILASACETMCHRMSWVLGLSLKMGDTQMAAGWCE